MFFVGFGVVLEGFLGELGMFCGVWGVLCGSNLKPFLKGIGHHFEQQLGRIWVARVLAE